MGHNSAVSGHPISTSFSQVDGWSIDPRVLERHICSHGYTLEEVKEAPT